MLDGLEQALARIAELEAAATPRPPVTPATTREQELLDRIAELEAATTTPPVEAKPSVVVQVHRVITEVDLDKWANTRSAQHLGLRNIRCEDGEVRAENKFGVAYRGYMVRSKTTGEIRYAWSPAKVMAGYISSSDFGDHYENMAPDTPYQPFIHFDLSDGET